jgi:hypothetical protein
VSERGPFAAAAAAAARWWDNWLEVARARVHRDQIPPVLELQTICRETGCSMPELEVFARVLDQPPALLVLGADADLFTEVAAVFGYSPRLPALPDAPIVWITSGNSKARIRLSCGRIDNPLSRSALTTFLGGQLPSGDLIVIHEETAIPALWNVLWMPRPSLFSLESLTPSQIEVLVGQRAALAVADEIPQPLSDLLDSIGQKRWTVSRDSLASPDDRRRLIEEIAALTEDRPQDLELRASTAWKWLGQHLLDRIAERKRSYQLLLNQYNLKLTSTRHLLGQYRANWTGGVRTLCETYLQNRAGGNTFAHFYDPQKTGPDAESFLAALALPALWSKLEEHLTDRMADFITGLSGLATKIELSRVTLADAHANWPVRQLAPRCETVLQEKRIFPAGGGKKGRLVGSLIGRKQAVVDERRTQVNRAVRTLVQFIESEFSAWCGDLVNAVENGVTIQLAAALVNHGYADPETLQSSLHGLDRLEAAISGHRASLRTPEALTIEWLNTLLSRHWIPLYQPR